MWKKNLQWKICYYILNAFKWQRSEFHCQAYISKSSHQQSQWCVWKQKIHNKSTIKIKYNTSCVKSVWKPREDKFQLMQNVFENSKLILASFVPFLPFKSAFFLFGFPKCNWSIRFGSDFVPVPALQNKIMKRLSNTTDTRIHVYKFVN